MVGSISSSGAVTVMWQVALSFPSLVATLTIASPGASAFTVPSSATVATSSLSEVHTKVNFSAAASRASALALSAAYSTVSTSLAPTSSSKLSGNEIPVICTPHAVRQSAIANDANTAKNFLCTTSPPYHKYFALFYHITFFLSRIIRGYIRDNHYKIGLR